MPPTTTFITKVGPTEEELSEQVEEAMELIEETVEDKDDPHKIKNDGKVAEACEIIDHGFCDAARLSSGAQFGALSLIDGKPRMCTIKCITRCHFIVLTRTSYQKALAEIDRKK